MRKKSIRRIAIALTAVVLVGILLIWMEFGSYAPGTLAKSAILPGGEIEIDRQGSLTVFAPDAPERGFIFYPGGRVAPTSYAPLLRALAEDGWLCVLVEMPFDLAVLNMNAAAGIPERFPEIDSWTIGGHSLGGAMAAGYAAKHPEDYDALILLAAYSTQDLTDSDLRVVSLYGENDGVLNREKYEQYRKNLPADTIEKIIPGGNHALFGDYGAQKGDGEASISAEEQIAVVVEMMRFDEDE